MALPIKALLPVYGIVVTLRFVDKAQMAFFHQPALTAFIRHLAGSPDLFEQFIRIDACESGRMSYKIGDLYRFTIIGLNGCLPILNLVLDALNTLPDSALQTKDKLAFGLHCRLESVLDLFSDTQVRQADQLVPFGVDNLLAEAKLWQQYSTVRLCFVSPVRWLKEKSVREGLKGEARYCRQKSDLSEELISDRFYDSFAELLKKHGVDSLPLRSDAVRMPLLDESHLFWLDCDYHNRSSSRQLPMGGMTGELHLSVEHLSINDWQILVLAQYLGVGQRCTFGWGRFQLQSGSGELSYRRVFPARSLLDRVEDNDNLLSAFAHVDNNAKTESYSVNDDADDGFFERLQRDIDQIADGQFNPPVLQGYVIDKADGSYRALAVPPFRDRVLQRAVAQALTPAMESLQSQHSYGFRPGRSRLTAKYAIQSAWREGYRWVYESDIDDFFDNVSWSRLEVRLRALWGFDPLVDALLNWVKADVEFDHQLIKRKQGLPQGSPISPMLANLMLDDFDNDMQAAGFKLIRYADDFVVLCQSPEQAEQAHLAAELSLQEHGLALDDKKTNITSMENGFHYLGYLFVNDMVLDSPNRLRKTGQASTQVSPNSWLAKLGARKPKPIEVIAEAKDDNNLSIDDELPKVVSFGERIGHGLLLCITGQFCSVSTKDQRVQIRRDDELIYDVPWRHLQAVLLMGSHAVSSPALKAAMKFNIPLHFTSSTGQYEGVVWNGEAGVRGHALWLKQQSVCTDVDLALSASKQIVSSRIAHLRESLRLRNCKAEVAQLVELLAKVPNAKDLTALNGLEGSATRVYFSAMTAFVPEVFGFDGRNRRPPKDPFNALLSLGYMVLYSCVESVLRIDGLLPWCGFYHQPRGRHAALASDLMEPFRHVVERLALALLKRRELNIDDFSFKASGACLLSDSARGLFLSKLMAKFDSKLTSQHGSEAKSMFEHIHEQNLELIRWLDEGGEFSAWRVR